MLHVMANGAILSESFAIHLAIVDDSLPGIQRT